MLLNLSSDVPFIYADKFTFFERKNLEEQLPNYFFENVEKINDIYVITWPWYFSSTRVWVEVINILNTLNIVENIYFLDKISFYQKLWYNQIYLFTWNKNKFYDISTTKVTFRKDLDFDILLEELFEIKLDWFNYIKYSTFIKKYKDLEWNKLKNNDLLKPFYIFEPIVS